MSTVFKPFVLIASTITLAVVGVVTPATAAPEPARSTIYVAPRSRGPERGTRTAPFHSIAAAQAGVRRQLPHMHTDVHVVLADGTYALAAPLHFTAADSGRNGHDVIYEAAPGAHAIVSGGTAIHGWKPSTAVAGAWVAPVPRSLRTRQLYVDGQRAPVASGPPPVTLTQTVTGYATAGTAMATWRNPSEIEMIYDRGPSNWTQSRCRVHSIRGTSITMVQPCWDNTTRRDDAPHSVLARSLFNQKLQVTPLLANAFELLDQPGEWYLDQHEHRLYVIPTPGQDLTRAEVIAPRLETLLAGSGTTHAPIHDVTFRGLTFAHATWLAPSGPNGYSDFQTAQILSGTNAYRRGGDCSKGETCFYSMLTQVPANVSFDHDRNVKFTDNRFVHLGATGLAFGTASTGAQVSGNEFTDTSCAGVAVGRFDNPKATATDRTAGTVIRANWVHAVAAEYQSCPGISVGYTEHVRVDHNQVNDLPYTGIATGWGGWRERLGNLAPLPNYSRANTVTNNLVFDYMKVMADGGGIYTNGSQGTSLSDGQLIAGNVVLHQPNLSWAVYNDNGSENVTVRANVVYDVLKFAAAATVFPGVAPEFSFGGCSSGPVAYSGNWSIQPNPVKGLLGPLPTCGGHPLVGATSTDNHVISSLAEVPPAALAGAGLPMPARARLSPTPRPTNLPPFESL